MPTSRTRDRNGFLLVKDCPISTFGIFDYSAGQLGLPGDPMRIVKVYRPESAVNDPESIASLRDIPLIDDHEMLSGFGTANGETAPEEYGVDGVLTSNLTYSSPWLRGDLKIFSSEMQDALNSGKKDLSLGYACKFELSPGTWNGQDYEVIQTHIRGNHIALVKKGRIPGARVLDGLCFDHLSFDVTPSDEEDEMKLNKKAFDNAVEQLKALLPALQQFLNEEATEPAHQGGAPAAGAEGGAAAVQTGEADAGGAAAAPATTEGAEATATPAAAAAGEGESATPDMAALVAQIEAVLSQIKAAIGGEAEQNGTTSGEAGAATAGEGEAGDNVEGLEGSTEGEAGADAGEPGKTAPVGPAAGTPTKAADSVQHFYADLAAKTSLYDRLSQVVGAFDHKAMDAAGVAFYGVKKLGLKVAKGQETIALDAYLTGVEKAAQATKTRVQQKAKDSSESVAEIDAYLKGSK